VKRPSRDLVARVVARAVDRCEYCMLSQDGQEARFHIDHVVPVAAGGPTTFENLAVACVSCSLRKGARLTACDPVSGDQVRLFNPRLDSWREHFLLEDNLVVGLTAEGRATVSALAMNRPIAVAIRRAQDLPQPEQ
jgi:hypothetical protein